MFKTYDQGCVRASQRRTGYLPSLTYDTENTRDGIVLYEKKQGEHTRIDAPQDFIRCYMSCPEKALTRSPDNSFMTLEEAPLHQQALERVVAVFNEGPSGGDPPKISDLGASLSIGGLVIKKRVSQSRRHFACGVRQWGLESLTNVRPGVDCRRAFCSRGFRDPVANLIPAGRMLKRRPSYTGVRERLQVNTCRGPSRLTGSDPLSHRERFQRE